VLIIILSFHILLVELISNLLWKPYIFLQMDMIINEVFIKKKKVRQEWKQQTYIHKRHRAVWLLLLNHALLCSFYKSLCAGYHSNLRCTKALCLRRKSKQANTQAPMKLGPCRANHESGRCWELWEGTWEARGWNVMGRALGSHSPFQPRAI
jgi:hypothetical protein